MAITILVRCLFRLNDGHWFSHGFSRRARWWRGERRCARVIRTPCIPERPYTAVETSTRRRYRSRGVGRGRVIQTTPTVRHWSSPYAAGRGHGCHFHVTGQTARPSPSPPPLSYSLTLPVVPSTKGPGVPGRTRRARRTATDPASTVALVFSRRRPTVSHSVAVGALTPRPRVRVRAALERAGNEAAPPRTVGSTCVPGKRWIANLRPRERINSCISNFILSLNIRFFFRWVFRPRKNNKDVMGKIMHF